MTHTQNSGSGFSGAVLDGEAPVVVELDTAAPPAELVALINDGCDRVEDAPHTPALVLRLSASGPGSNRPVGPGIREVTRWERTVRRVERLGALTVVAADGVCSGAALDLFLAADYRIAGTGLRMVLRDHNGLPWPGMTLYRLAHQVGSAQARRLLLRGDALAVEHAHALGLVDEISDDPARAEAVPGEVGQSLGGELAVCRRLVLEAMTTSYEDAIGTHLAACDRSLRHRAAAGLEG